MTSERERVDCYGPLVTFLVKNVDVDDVTQLARRIGAYSKLKVPNVAGPTENWQAILEAALSARCLDSLFHDVDQNIGDADRPEFRQIKLACLEAQFQAIVCESNPDLGSVSEQLVAARSLSELGEAAKTCRKLLSHILSAMEVGSAERATLLAASTQADVDNLAGRIGTLALKVLRPVDRVIDLADSDEEYRGAHFHVTHDPDDFGGPGHTADSDPQTLMLARSARDAAWVHMQYLLTVLHNKTVLPKSLGPPAIQS